MYIMEKEEVKYQPSMYTVRNFCTVTTLNLLFYRVILLFLHYAIPSYVVPY